MAIVDDAGEIRMLLRAQLGISSEFDVCAEGANGNEAIAIARGFRPDVMLLDNSMPELDGVDALPRILAESPRTAVVMLSAAADAQTLERAVSLGAAGCLVKSLGAGPLPQRLLEVLRGERTIQNVALNLCNEPADSP